MRRLSFLVVRLRKGRVYGISYLEACNIFRRVSNFYLEKERSKVERCTSPLFRQICGDRSFGRLTVKVSGGGVVELVIRQKQGYTYTDENNFHPDKFPVVFREVLDPEELVVVLNNSRNYRSGLFYSSFVPLLLNLENLLKEVIEGEMIPYSFSQNFKNGSPDYMFFSVNGDPWGTELSSSTLNTIELLKKRYLASLN